MSELHSFNPRIQISQKNPMGPVLCDLLDDFVKYMVDMVQDIDYGWKYVNEKKKGIDYAEMHSNIYEYGSDMLLTLITLAEEENIPETILKEIFFNSMYLELTVGKGDENLLFNIDMPLELDVTKELNSIKGYIECKDGSVKNQQTNNMYKTLCDIINNEKLVEYAQDKILHLDIERDGTATLDIAQGGIPLTWSAYIDENKFKNKLLKELELSEQDFKQITNVS